MTERFAIYYAPPKGSALGMRAESWLAQEDLLPRTVSARRYGFHATLKAPMRLAAGAGERTLIERVDALAGTLHPVPLGPLAAVYIDGFVALTPPQPPVLADHLAARCVTELDDLRAPLDEDELARRRPERLDARQRELLELWGYPHVLERFRLHMTLTGPIAPAVAQHVIGHLRPAVARLHEQQQPMLDRLCVFHEPQPGSPLRRIHDAPLAP